MSKSYVLKKQASPPLISISAGRAVFSPSLKILIFCIKYALVHVSDRICERTMEILSINSVCCGYKPALEAFLLDGILRHDKFFVAEAHFVFGERHVIVIL